MDEQALLCMNCGHANLFYLHCKIRCENCGFLLDCSDLDVGSEIKRATLKTLAVAKHPHQETPTPSDKTH